MFVLPGEEDIVHLTGGDNDGINDDFRPEHATSPCGTRFRKAQRKRDNFWTVVGKDVASKANEDSRPFYT